MPDVADVQCAGHVHPEIHSQGEVQYPDVGSDKSAGHQWRKGRYNMNLKIITYMRSNEAFNDNIKKILTLSLKLNTKISCIIFTDNDRKFEFGL